MAGTRAVGPYLDFLPKSWYELTYAFLAHQLGLPAPACLEVLLFRKLTKIQLAAGVPAFQHHTLPTPSLHCRTTCERLWHRDVSPALTALLRTLSGPGEDAPRQFSNCTGPFYNSPCPIYNHCHRELPIAPASDLPYPHIPRYSLPSTPPS